MTNEQERLEQEEFERELALLRATGVDFSIMGKHGFPDLTLITEDEEYQPNEEGDNEKG